MPYTATVSVSKIDLATPIGDDSLLGTVNSSGATRRFKVSDVVSLAAGGVSSVNGETGAVAITFSGISAASDTHTHVAADITDFSAASSQYGPVVSVNGETGVVVLTSADISDFATEAAKYGPVVSVNGLTGTLTIAAGSNVTVSTTGSSITIAAESGGDVVSVNGQTGEVVLSVVDVTAASAIHASQHQTGGTDEIPAVVTTASITASVNDYALPVADIFRLQNETTTAVNITGLSSAADGSAKLLMNVSTHTSASYTLKHDNTNSTAASRILVPWAGDYVLSPGGGAALVIYDGTDGRWRVV
jgi:hypothetical protein